MENQFRLESVECIIDTIDDTIRALEDIGDDGKTDIDVLNDMKRRYKAEAEEIQNEIDVEWAADHAALEREYYRGVL